LQRTGDAAGVEVEVSAAMQSAGNVNMLVNKTLNSSEPGRWIFILITRVVSE
jgi:hypothetical protein